MYISISLLSNTRVNVLQYSVKYTFVHLENMSLVHITFSVECVKNKYIIYN